MQQKITQAVPLVLALLAAVFGREVAFTPEQTAAAGFAVFAVYQLVSRYILYFQGPMVSDLPDVRAFFGTSTAWIALANVLLGVAYIISGDIIPLPNWALPAAQLLALAVGQQRLQAAKWRLSDREGQERLNRKVRARAWHPERGR